MKKEEGEWRKGGSDTKVISESNYRVGLGQGFLRT